MHAFPKYFFIFWTLIFLLFAYFQLNDPDPEIWVSIYVAAMVFTGLAVRGKHPLIPLSIAILVCIIGALYYFPESVSGWIGQELEQKDLTMKTPQMEEARETFGLLIIAVVLGYSAFLGWREKRHF
ncbi:transmembrane 220 family protein [Rhodonellum sp.]|uniref:transmembrane 220 family protein n=1 Tax=Rhodonellum sp. TaxID=2231180 RepID=UPI0027187694|nr:transmembrane 220 family protein [Rhodonellum sp.]MDO9551757.1 transmembrane 220 family protein [Rhodonellum sp.]